MLISTLINTDQAVYEKIKCRIYEYFSTKLDMIPDPRYDLEADYTEAFLYIDYALKVRLAAFNKEKYKFFQKFGEGCYGQVFQVEHRVTKEMFAIKTIKMERDNEFPVINLREIRILYSMRHENILSLKEICYNFDQSLFNHNARFHLVLEYCERNLTQLIIQTHLPNAAKKILIEQLLKGVFYLHSNHVLHRDLKPCNILVNDKGVLKIGDFGLSRFIMPPFNPDKAPLQAFTGRLITLWYRPPEILLDYHHYGKAADVWSVGCILVEFWTTFPLLRGVNEYDQLLRIIAVCGSIDSQIYSGVEALKSYHLMVRKLNWDRLLREVLSFFIDDTRAIDLIDKLLVCDPAHRITIDEALSHDYFYSITPSPPIDPSIFARRDISNFVFLSINFLI